MRRSGKWTRREGAACWRGCCWRRDKGGRAEVKLSLIHILFVYNPVLLMQGGALEIIQSLITALLGIYSAADRL